MAKLTKEQKELEDSKVISKKKYKVKNIPKTIKNPKTGKEYKAGEDYEAEAVHEELCKHEKLSSLGHSYYICDKCKVIFQVPISLQYSYSQLMEYWNNIITNLNSHFPKDEKGKGSN